MSLTNPTADLAERGCILTGIPRELVFSPDRSGRVPQIRFAAWHIARKDGWSLHTLADVFQRDHGTVIHGLKIANRLLATDKWFRELVRKLENTETLATRGLEKRPENHAGDGQPSGLPAVHGSASEKSPNTPKN